MNQASLRAYHEAVYQVSAYASALIRTATVMLEHDGAFEPPIDRAILAAKDLLASNLAELARSYWTARGTETADVRWAFLGEEPVRLCGGRAETSWHAATLTVGNDVLAAASMTIWPELLTDKPLLSEPPTFDATNLQEPTILTLFLGMLTHKDSRELEDLPARLEIELGQALAGDAEPEAPADTPERANKPNKPLRRPSKKALQAWHVQTVLSLTNQTDIAAEMTRQGTTANQGQVSKWLSQVEAYRAAGGLMPTPEAMSKPETWDPADLDMGPRQDHLTSRQRSRRSADSDDE